MEVDDGAGDGPVAGPVGVKRRVPRFQVVRVVEHLDQARRVVTETVTGDAPLAEDEEWRIVWSRVPEYRLRYRPELDLVFPCVTRWTRCAGCTSPTPALTGGWRRGWWRTTRSWPGPGSGCGT